MLNTYSIPPAPPVPTVLWIFVSSSSWTYLLTLLHFSPVNTTSIYFFTHFFPPISPGSGATIHLYGPPDAGLHHSYALPSYAVRPEDFLARSCYWIPFFGWPLFDFLGLRPGKCQPQGFSRKRVPSSLCLPPSSANLPPPAGLDRKPSPLPVLSGWRCVLLTLLSHVHPHRFPPRLCHLLVSSGF